MATEWKVGSAIEIFGREHISLVCFWIGIGMPTIWTPFHQKWLLGSRIYSGFIWSVVLRSGTGYRSGDLELVLHTNIACETIMIQITHRLIIRWTYAIGYNRIPSRLKNIAIVLGIGINETIPPAPQRLQILDSIRNLPGKKGLVSTPCIIAIIGIPFTGDGHSCWLAEIKLAVNDLCGLHIIDRTGKVTVNGYSIIVTGKIICITVNGGGSRIKIQDIPHVLGILGFSMR